MSTDDLAGGRLPAAAARGDQRTTVVHLLRHGEVHNPRGILYGRLPDYHLSDLGQEMAARIAETVRDHDIAHLVASPLDRPRRPPLPVPWRSGSTSSPTAG